MYILRCDSAFWTSHILRDPEGFSLHNRLYMYVHSVHFLPCHYILNLRLYKLSFALMYMPIHAYL